MWEYRPWNFGRQFTIYNSCAWIDGSQSTISWDCNWFASLEET